jgi:hypothetical protein
MAINMGPEYGCLLTCDSWKVLAVNFPLRILELNCGILVISLIYNHSGLGKNT